MATVTISIPDDKINLVKDTFWELYPVKTDAEGNPMYNKAQWAKIALVNIIKRDVNRYKQLVRLREAEAVVFDDTVAS